MVRNAIAGISVAKACGLVEPTVGFLNLEGAARAVQIVRELSAKGYTVKLTGSTRGDVLLRGNDVLPGAVDVLVCDSLTGNAVVKLLSTFSTGGRIEVTGDGYGPGVGDGAGRGHHFPGKLCPRCCECAPLHGARRARRFVSSL